MPVQDPSRHHRLDLSFDFVLHVFSRTSLYFIIRKQIRQPIEQDSTYL
jgi:hypothetical protein